jgi:hypothetical protein
VDLLNVLEPDDKKPRPLHEEIERLMRRSTGITLEELKEFFTKLKVGSVIVYSVDLVLADQCKLKLRNRISGASNINLFVVTIGNIAVSSITAITPRGVCSIQALL